MIVRRKSTAVLGMNLVLVGLSSAQQVLVNPQLPSVPVLTCRTIQLQAEDGKPIALAPVQLKILEVKETKGNAAGAAVSFKLFKKLTTGAEGKLSLPELKPDTYYLFLPEAKKRTSGAFAIPDDTKPGDCTQTFVLKDKGNMVHIEAAGSGEAADKK